MNDLPLLHEKKDFSCVSVVNKYLYNTTKSIPSSANMCLRHRFVFSTLLFLFFAFSGYAQKSKDIEPVLYCVKELGNGLYQASFGYVNPTRKEVIIDENGSIIKSNKGKRVAKGLNKFKPGSEDKVFTKEFGSDDYVEWTIVSNGNSHTVIANANSAKKCDPDDGFIFPVIGNGKALGLSGNELESYCLDVSGTTPPELIFQSKTDNGIVKVLIEIIPKIDAALMVTKLQAAPFSIGNADFLLDPSVYDYTDFSAIDVYMEKTKVCLLDGFGEFINFARPVYPPNIKSGGVLSQGDSAQTSDLVRESFRMKNSDGVIVPVDGTGITVGVMSDSYDTNIPGTAAGDVSNGELPEDVVVLKDNAFKATDEGRAMMQIVHDVAPGATLQFHTATASPRQFEVGFNALAAACDIIVDDITFITEPFFGIGRIAEAINNSGKFHFTSAGNIANRAFQSSFNPTTTMPSTNFIDPASSTVAHDFDPDTNNTDYLQKISVKPGTYLIALQWKEEVASQNINTGALEDLDIYIVDDQGRLLVGNNRVNTEGDPTEIIVFRATGTGDANIMITSAKGPTEVPFRYIAFRTTANDGTPDGLEIIDFFDSGASTISGHAMNIPSITVGAVDYRNAGSPVAEYFSSYGGTLSDGTNLEVDLYAPDGGNTSVTTIGQPATCNTCDGDNFLNFYGTSAAAPHAAAATALLLSAAPSWFPPTVADLAANLKTSYTNDQALQAFKNAGTSFTAADDSSSRFLNTLATFKSIAAQTARITELVVQDGKTPSAEPFTVTIIGEFFPENVEDVTVLFDGQPLQNVAYATGANGETVITATVPTFSGNPELIVKTTSLTGGGDGGDSDPAYILDEGKIALNIIANSAQFEYGQDIKPSYYRADPTQPDYVAPYVVEGLPEGVTYESLALEDNLPSIILTNSFVDDQLESVGYPVVFDYVITPSFGDEVLTPEQQAKYQINFISGYNDPDLGKVGYLTITKKDLTITTTSDPIPTFTYGEAIVVPLIYDYGTDGITDDADFRAYITSTHNADFFVENRLALINKYTALISKYPALISTFNGGSWIASEQTLTNKYTALISKYPALISNMGIINLDENHFDSYFANDEYDPDIVDLAKYTALISKYTALISAEALARGDVQLNDPIENSDGTITNKYTALISKYPALISKYTALISSENNDSDYESIFAIVSDEEPLTGETDEDGLPIVEVPTLYALNMITGLDVTVNDEGHLLYPGAFLNTLSNNFNVTYVPGEYFVEPAPLIANTVNLTIPYGQLLTKEDLTTTFEGFVFDDPNQETVATVFPEADGGIPYYFVKEGDDTPIEIENLKERGKYLIKLGNPQNYEVTSIVNETYGTLTIEAAPLTFDFQELSIVYGGTPVITPNFDGFAEGDDATVLEVEGKIPYYFMKEGDVTTVYTIGGPYKMDVGIYEMFITDDPDDNYSFDPDTKLGNLTITEAPLQFNPGTLELKYGVTPVFDPAPITGFADGESSAVLNNAEGKIPYYFMKEGDVTTVYTIGGPYKMDVGVYDMFLTDVSGDNYSVENVVGRGKLTVVAAQITVQTDNLERVYGTVLTQADLTTNFNDFAYDESIEDVFGSAVVPYYLADSDGEYEINAIKDVGVYDIRIRETNDNYIFDFDGSFNAFEVTKKALTAHIDNLIINQGETPVFTSTITGFIPGENVSNVYTTGVPYYIVDDYGAEADYDDAGAFTIMIRDDRKNYSMSSNPDATLFINPFNANIRKVRTYSDCVVYNGPGDYTVTYRYENDNSDPVFVALGVDNNLTGPGFIGNMNELPTVFMPGTGTFEIDFNGQQLVWSLTSYEGTHKSSVSSASTSGSGECDAKLDGVYTLYPNPVTDFYDFKLTITQNVAEVSTVYILDMYGRILKTDTGFNGTNDKVIIDMSNSNLYPGGMYIVRIVSLDQVRTYNIIKQ